MARERNPEYLKLMKKVLKAGRQYRAALVEVQGAFETEGRVRRDEPNGDLLWMWDGSDGEVSMLYSLDEIMTLANRYESACYFE